MSEIRQARADDWAAIWPIVRGVADAGDTYALPAQLGEADARSWWMEEPPGSTVVALDESGTVVGTAKMGPNRPGRGDHVGTASFMVADSARGRGVGRALGEYVVDRLRENGFRSIQFNAVVESNASAVRLWRSLGFEVIGTVPEAFRHPTDGLVGLHVMYRRL